MKKDQNQYIALLNENGKEVYVITLQLAKQTGIILMEDGNLDLGTVSEIGGIALQGVVMSWSEFDTSKLQVVREKTLYYVEDILDGDLDKVLKNLKQIRGKYEGLNAKFVTEYDSLYVEYDGLESLRSYNFRNSIALLQQKEKEDAKQKEIAELEKRLAELKGEV